MADLTKHSGGVKPATAKSLTEYERGYNTGYITARRAVGAGVDDTKQLRTIADNLVRRAEAIYKLIGVSDLPTEDSKPASGELEAQQ